ncbi:MAG: alpha/beta fold hydrolase [Alphaproteobacteria bacterium]|nr:alpha/beta fold hydrolase [Alphaproteobacteria bacterium]MCB9792568.1 alpha/beta fold hydrolase [Alphaproteobacteria bacterium]
MRPLPSREVPRDLARTAARLALKTAYYSLQPANREQFARDPDRRLLRRVYYEADDGWQAPLFRVEPRPGGSGEPVILAHGLGVNRHSLDYCADLSLARALSQAGFEVFLLEHRGDRSAIAPPDAQPFDFDDIATRDVPAAIEAVKADTGARRVLWVGHALGGQLLYAHLAHGGAPDIAAGVTLSAALRFTPAPSTARALQLARQLLPRRLTLPTRAAAALMAPSSRGSSRVGSSAMPGEVARGLMLHGTEDLSAGLLRQAMLWMERGALCDRHDRLDYLAAMQGVEMPLMLVTAAGDPLCAPEQAIEAREALRGPGWHLALGTEWGHLDPLLAAEAPREVFPKLVGWLEGLKGRCW